MPPKERKRKRGDNEHSDLTIQDLKNWLQKAYEVDVPDTKEGYIDALKRIEPKFEYDHYDEEQLAALLKKKGVWFVENNNRKAEYYNKLKEIWHKELKAKEDKIDFEKRTNSFTKKLLKVKNRWSLRESIKGAIPDDEGDKTESNRIKEAEERFYSPNLANGTALFGNDRISWATTSRIATDERVQQALKVHERVDQVYQDIHTQIRQNRGTPSTASSLDLLSAHIPGRVNFIELELKDKALFEFFWRKGEPADVGDITTIAKLLALSGDRFDQGDIQYSLSDLYDLVGRTDTDSGDSSAKPLVGRCVAKPHGGNTDMDDLPKILPNRMKYSGELLKEFNDYHIPALEAIFAKACQELPKSELHLIARAKHEYPPLEDRAQKFWNATGTILKRSFRALAAEIDELGSLSVDAGKLTIPCQGVKGFNARVEPDFALKVNGSTFLVMELKRDEAFLNLAAADSEFLDVPSEHKDRLGPIEAARGLYANCCYRYHYDPSLGEQAAKDHALRRALRDVATGNKDAVAHALRLSSQAITQAVLAGAPLVGIATAEFVMICPISKEQDFSKWTPEGYCTNRDVDAHDFYDMRDKMWSLNFDDPLILPVYQLPGVGTVIASLVVLWCMHDPTLRKKLQNVVPEYEAIFENFKEYGEEGEKRQTKGKGKCDGQPRTEMSLAGVFDDARFAAVILAKMHLMETELKKDMRLLSDILREAGSGSIDVRSNMKLGRSVQLHQDACDGDLSSIVFYDKLEGGKEIPSCSKFVGISSKQPFMNEIEAYRRIAQNPKVRMLVPALRGAGVQVDLAKIDAFNKLFTGESSIEEYEKLTRSGKGAAVLKERLTKGMYSLRTRPKDGNGNGNVTGAFDGNTTVAPSDVKDRYAITVSLDINEVCAKLESACQGEGPINDEVLSAMFDNTAPLAEEYKEDVSQVEFLFAQWYLDMERLFPVEIDDEDEIENNQWDLYDALLECGIRHLDLEEGRNFMKTRDGWKVFDFGNVEFYARCNS